MNPSADQLREDLATHGYAKIKTGNIDGFHRVCESLGKVSQTIEVRLTPGQTQYPYRPDAVPFHTDHPRVPIVAWHCERQDSDDGANLLVDTREIVKRLSPTVRMTLTTIHMRMVHRNDLHPLLSLDPYHVYWLPIIIREAMEAGNESQKSAIAAFQDELTKHASARKNALIRMQPGEALFVNNRLILHGRGAITEGSERFLLRNYIVTT